jgi:predicted transcriptional regulator
MATILDQAIAKARADDLDDETRTAIREGIAQAKRGEFVPDEDIQALWKRYGL